MLRRLWANYKKDFLHGHRHFYVYITLASSVIFILFIQFVLPENYSEPDVYQYIDPAYTSLLDEVEVSVLGSPAAVVAALEENPNAYGIIIEQIDNQPVVTLYTQTNADEEFANLIKTGLLQTFNNEQIREYPTRVLVPELANVTFKERFIPLIIVMDSALIGMFLLSVMLFVEKDQKMHTAYMVTPGGLLEHLLSKALNMMTLSLISGTLVVGVLRGVNANYAYLYMVLIPASFVGAGFGLLLGAVYKNVSDSMTGIFTLYLVLSIPIITYVYPSFNPWFNQLIPTHYMVQGMEAAVLPYSGFTIIWQSALALVGFGLVLYGVSHWLYKRALYQHS
jgi:hypothetical protein